MRIFNSTEQLPEFTNTVFTQGTFDGVHLGHQKILKRFGKEVHGVLLTVIVGVLIGIFLVGCHRH